MGSHALGREPDIGKIGVAGEGEIAGVGFGRAEPHRQVALQAQAVAPAVIRQPADQARRAIEAIGHQRHDDVLRQPADDGLQQGLLRGEADGAVGFLHPPGQRQGPLAEAHAQHQDSMAVRVLGLVHDQRDLAPVPGQIGQDFDRKRLHDRVTIDPIIGQEPRNPLIAHVRAFGRQRQARGQFDQIGAPHVQHRRHQQSQIAALGHSLAGKLALQFGRDPFRPVRRRARYPSHPDTANSAESLNHTQILAVKRLSDKLMDV